MQKEHVLKLSEYRKLEFYEKSPSQDNYEQLWISKKGLSTVMLRLYNFLVIPAFDISIIFTIMKSLVQLLSDVNESIAFFMAKQY